MLTAFANAWCMCIRVACNSTPGQHAGININAVYTSANSQTVQKHTQVYCESKNCGGAMNGYLQALEDHGCVRPLCDTVCVIVS